jgi:hypothetical protein
MFKARGFGARAQPGLEGLGWVRASVNYWEGVGR